MKKVSRLLCCMSTPNFLNRRNVHSDNDTIRPMLSSQVIFGTGAAALNFKMVLTGLCANG